jgi:hypothetical protein
LIAKFASSNISIHSALIYPTFTLGIIPLIITRTFLLTGVCYAASALSQFIVDDYKQILVIGCEEASKWSTSEPTLHVHTNLELAKLEEELQIRGQSIHVWIFALVHQCL